jgi:hypothetical protein
MRQPNPYYVVRSGAPAVAARPFPDPNQVRTIAGTRRPNPYFVIRDGKQQITERKVAAPFQRYNAPYTIHAPEGNMQGTVWWSTMRGGCGCNSGMGCGGSCNCGPGCGCGPCQAKWGMGKPAKYRRGRRVLMGVSMKGCGCPFCGGMPGCGCAKGGGCRCGSMNMGQSQAEETAKGVGIGLVTFGLLSLALVAGMATGEAMREAEDRDW